MELTRQDKEDLLTLYLFAIEEVSRLENPEDIAQFINNNNLHAGLCYLVRKQFDLDEDEAYNLFWVKKHVGEKSYLGITPCEADYQQEGTLEALRLRADVLIKESELLNRTI